MRHVERILGAALLVVTPAIAPSQRPAPKTLVAVLAHADDEAAVVPMLARYAREGHRVFMIIASDGAQGFGNQGRLTRPDSGPQGDQLAMVRGQEARCAAEALGAQPPILLGFPDGKLGDYIGDRQLVYRVTQRIAEELERLRPDVIVTWGPDGGTGHPDHRMVSNIVTQLSRFGAPGVPERVFYMYLLVEGMRVMSARGEPPMLIPQAKYFTVRVPFQPQDFQAAARAMACHKTQFPPEVAQRALPVFERAWNGVVLLIPAFPTPALTDLFR